MSGTEEFLADPEYRARRAALAAEHEYLVQRNREDSAPVVRDLAQVGFGVEFVDDLYGLGLDYRAAVPVLLRWLPLVDNPDVKRGIIRALSVEWARPVAARPLVDELHRQLPACERDSDDVRWTIANALDVVADDSVLDDLLDLLPDERLDRDTRATLLRPLGNMRDPRAADHLVQMLRTENEAFPFVVSALIAVGRLRFVAARDVVERHLQHHDREVRQEAKRALKAIDRRRAAAPRG